MYKDVSIYAIGCLTCQAENPINNKALSIERNESSLGCEKVSMDE